MSAALVETVYADKFGAHPRVDPDFFFCGLEEERGSDAERAVACVGLTMADGGPVFVERYLDVPIDELIGESTGASCSRADIVQLGSVASGRGTAGLELYRAVPALLRLRGVRYAVMTSTRRSLALQERLGLRFNRVGPADPARLDPAELDRWGTFYDDGPIVVWASFDEQVEPFAQGEGGHRLCTVDRDLELLARTREAARV